MSRQTQHLESIPAANFLPKYLHKVVDLPVDLDDLFILAEVKATPAKVVAILLPPSSVRSVIVQDIQP